LQIAEVEQGSPDALTKAQGYLDACTKGTGTKFESLVLACANDDQKSIRQKMEQMVSYKPILISHIANTPVSIILDANYY